MGKQFPFLRGMAILFVLANHSISMSLWLAQQYGYRDPQPLLYTIFVVLKQMGLFTVPIFLFLSGTFFAFAMQNRPLKGSYRAVWTNLVSTFWPYLIWTLLFNLVVLFLFKQDQDWLQFFKNFLVGYPFNFVPLLMMFYLLAPLLIRAAKRFPLALIAAILLYQFFLLNVEHPGSLGITFPAWVHYLTPPVVREPLSLWAVFFPMGIVYHIHVRQIVGAWSKFAWIFAVGAAGFYLLDVFHELHLITFFPAAVLAPLVGMFLTPVIRPTAGPLTRFVEMVGKRSYGLYLMNLIVISLVWFGLEELFPALVQNYLVLVPVLFLSALYVPLGIIALAEKTPQRLVFRYVFG